MVKQAIPAENKFFADFIGRIFNSNELRVKYKREVMKALKIGILGLGTVGAGVFNVLKRNQEEIIRRTGRGIDVVMVCRRNTAAAQAIVGNEVPVVADPMALINHKDIDVIVELMGGDTLSKELVLAAIAQGKHIVTANKALLAVHGTEIFAAAHAKGVMVAYEAAVAGGIPIIKSLREGLSANRIEWVAGIINGTTNFILSEMREKGLDFAVVLKEAQRLGYAEADPTFDVEGVDAAHKLTLMSSIAFGVPVQFSKAFIQGISELTATDINYAEGLGYRIKLLGITKRTQKGIELRVHPCLVPSKRLIANVEGVMNAVMVSGDAVGTSLHYGKGAGSEPTASAVIADLIDIARLSEASPAQRVPFLAFQSQHLSDFPVLPMDQVVTSYYLRIRVADQTGVLADIASIFAQHNISIDALRQREADEVCGEGANQTDLVVLTHDCQEGQMKMALEQIQALSTVLDKVILIRKEELA